MSADLFAAFGMPDVNQQLQKTAPKTANITSPSVETTTAQEQQQWILQSKPIPKPARDKPTQSLWKQDEKGADVLFDASDDEDEDDFGDFEEAPANTKRDPVGKPSPSVQRHEQQEPQQQHIVKDLLGLDDFPDTKNTQPSNEFHPSYTSNNQFHHLQSVQPIAKSQSKQVASSDMQPMDIWADVLDVNDASHQHQDPDPVPQPGVRQNVSIDDDWGDFEDVGDREGDRPVISSMRDQAQVVQLSKDEDDANEEEEWDAFEDKAPSSVPHNQPNVASDHSGKSSPIKITTPLPSTSQPRPTNIPPPSTLLQLLPKLYQHLSQQSRLAATPSTLPQLILQIYITTARIISGRTHRWKRDTFLSQSTRISQAGLKNTGMKLTALDKGETIKEDQEAQEAVAAWQRHAAVLNAVMLRAKVQRPPMSLGASMTVRVGNGAGVLSAKECCAVCGLKRNERVTGIDVKVEDSFGEFWIEHWGHRDCYGFWYQYEGWLDKR